MKTNLDMLKTDSQKEVDGVWYPVAEGVAFLVARFGGLNSQNVQKAVTKYHKPYARQLEAGVLPLEKTKEIMIRTFVESSVLNWKGVEIDGKFPEFDKETCIKLFLELPDMASDIINFATDKNSYKESVGNS